MFNRTKNQSGNDDSAVAEGEGRRPRRTRRLATVLAVVTMPLIIAACAVILPSILTVMRLAQAHEEMATDLEARQEANVPPRYWDLDEAHEIADTAVEHWRSGEYAYAEQLLLKALETPDRYLDPTPGITIHFPRAQRVGARIRRELAAMYTTQDRVDEAVVLMERAVDLLQRSDGDEHEMTLAAKSQLAWTYRLNGRYEDAESILHDVIEVGRRIRGSDHAETLADMHELAFVYTNQDRHQDAADLREDIRDRQRASLGVEHEDTLVTMHLLAMSYEALRRYDEAEELLTETIQLRRRVLGETANDTLISMHNLAMLYRNRGRYDEAVALFRHAMELAEDALGEAHPTTIATMRGLAGAYERAGNTFSATRLRLRIEDIQGGAGSEN